MGKVLTEEQKQRKREYQKQYWIKRRAKAEHSCSYEARKEYHAEYRKREVRKDSLKEYNSSNKRRATTSRYSKTEKGRNHQYKRYGITAAEYDVMLVAQNNMCPIGPHKFGSKGRHRDSPCLDHCHKTGNVRMMLCRNHNLMLGLCNDSIDELQSAIEYLKQFKIED